MNLFISIVCLTLLFDFSQTLVRTIIVQWPEMHTYFEKLFEEEKYPSKTIFSNLCWQVTNSNVYIVKYKQVDIDSYEFSPEPKISHKVCSKFRTHMAKIFKIEDSHVSSELTETKVSIKGYDPLDMNVCHLYARKKVYVSRGIHVEQMTAHFLVGLTKSGMELLGAIGMADVNIAEGSLEDTTGETNMYREMFINTRLQYISRLQRVWIGAVVQAFETRTEPENYSITILYSTEDLMMTALPGQYNYICSGTPYMQYEVSNVDNDSKEKTIVILPDYFITNHYYFFYKSNVQLDLKHILHITFS